MNLTWMRQRLLRQTEADLPVIETTPLPFEPLLCPAPTADSDVSHWLFGTEPHFPANPAVSPYLERCQPVMEDYSKPSVFRLSSRATERAAASSLPLSGPRAPPANLEHRLPKRSLPALRGETRLLHRKPGTGRDVTAARVLSLPESSASAPCYPTDGGL